MGNLLQVLIVEDSESDAALVVRLLEKAGYDVHHQRVETAEDMREAIESKSWNVVISDYEMPEFSGPSALELFKSYDLIIPFIVVSGAVGEETIVRMMKLGAHDYVMKGKLTRLVPAIEREIQEAQLRLERQKVDKELAHERFLLRTLLENLPDRIYFKDLESRFIRLSRSQSNFFGLNDPGESLGKTDFDFFSEEHASFAFETEQNIIASGQPVLNIEEKETWPDGHISWVNTSKMPLIDKNGKITGTFGISSDITYRKLIDEANQESHQFLQDIIDALSIHLCVLDENGTIMMVNRAWREFADTNPPIPPDYCVGMNYLSVCDTASGPFSDEALPFAEGVRSVMRGEIPLYLLEYPCNIPAGEIRWFIARVTRFDWKGSQRIVVSHTNITERKRAEKTIKESEARFRAVTESAHDAIISFDSAHIIIGWTGGAREIFGWSSNEVVGRSVEQIIPGDFLKQHQNEIRRARDIENPIDIAKAVEFIGIRKNGRYFPLELSLAEWTTNQGKFFTMILRDITERKLTEEALQLRIAAIEAAANAIVITNQEGYVQWINRAFLELTGYDSTESLGKNLRILKSGEHDIAFYRQLWQTILAGKVWHGELINRRKDGTLYYEEMSITPVVDAQGKISRFIAIKQDISRRKIAEQALLEEKERYRSLYENIPVGIYRTTPGGKILMANPTLVDMLGYESIEELTERNVETDGYGIGFTRDDFKHKLDRDDQVIGLEYEIKRKDGSFITARENAHVVRDVEGFAEYYEGTIEDITDIRRSELQNRRLAAAIEHAGETVIMTDPLGHIQYANPAFEVMFGIAVKELIGKNVLIFSNAYLNLQIWQAILSIPQGGHIWHGDIRTNHANGDVLEIEASISPVFGLHEEVTSLVFVMHNVTQERKTESQERQSQKLEAIGHLAAGIAHEINTPTQFIGSNIRFLQNGFQDLLRLLEQVDQIVQSVNNEVDLKLCKEKIQNLTKELNLDYLKEEIPVAIDGSLKGIDRVAMIVNATKEFSNPGRHEKMPANINHAIENTLVVTNNEWKYIAEMKTDLAPDLPEIPCLVEEFNQVLLDLINNAADAIRESISLRPEGVKGTITISTQLNTPWVVVKVSDNGSGIPRNIQDRIFDPFFTTKEIGRGIIGHGLSTSYDLIVNKHEGKIWFETQEGKGTTFIIHLPISSDITMQ